MNRNVARLYIEAMMLAIGRDRDTAAIVSTGIAENAEKLASIKLDHPGGHPFFERRARRDGRQRVEEVGRLCLADPEDERLTIVGSWVLRLLQAETTAVIYEEAPNQIGIWDGNVEIFKRRIAEQA